MEYFTNYPKEFRTVVILNKWSTVLDLCRLLKSFGFKSTDKLKKSTFKSKVLIDLKEFKFFLVNKDYEPYSKSKTVLIDLTIEKPDVLIPDLRLIMEENIKAHKIKSIEDQFKQFIDKPTKIVENDEKNADYWYVKPGAFWPSK